MTGSPLSRSTTAAVEGCARHGRTDCDDCFMEATLSHAGYVALLELERDAARAERDRLLEEREPSENVIDRMAEALWVYENHDGDWRHYEGGSVGDRLRAQAKVLLAYATDYAPAPATVTGARLRESLEAIRPRDLGSDLRRVAIVERTPGEKAAYRQAYKAGVADAFRLVERHKGLTAAREDMDSRIRALDAVADAGAAA